MQENSSQESVSRSHDSTTTGGKGLTGSSGVKAATQKKFQLQSALGEFDKHNNRTDTQRKSLLSDEGNVLHVGKEKRGTIIKDIKSNRWSFTQAVKNSFSGWLKDEKDRVESTFRKPIPKKIVESSSTRTEVIKKAAQLGAMAGTDILKKTVIKKPIPKSTHSSIRIKPKDVPKEIGDTKPRWTHVIDEEEDVHTTKPTDTKNDGTSKSPTDKPKLLDAPDEHLLLSERTKIVKPESVKKTYRTPRVSHLITVNKTPLVNNRVTVSQSAIPSYKNPEPTIKAVTGEQAPKSEVVEIVDTEEPKVEELPELKIIKLENDSPAFSPISIFKTSNLEGNQTLPISTLVMVILFISVIAISTWSWNVIENNNRTEIETQNSVSNTSLIQADKTKVVTITSDSLSNEIIDAINTNDGFTIFEITPKDFIHKTVTDWNDILAIGTKEVEIGALNKNLFLIIDVNSKEVGKAGMLWLENNLPSELVSWFNITNDARFSSDKIDNRDIRVLGDKETPELTYVVLDEGLILIAGNKDDLSALINHTN